MNKENLKLLILSLQESETFSMHTPTWGENTWDEEFGDHPCGTAACIMGHVHSINEQPMNIFLGISSRQVADITMPEEEYADFMARPGQKSHITKSHAVRMLKKLLETGEVDWKGTKNPPKFDMKTWLSEFQNEELKEIKNEQRKPETADHSH